MLRKILMSGVSMLLASQVLAGNESVKCNDKKCKINYSGHEDKNIDIPDGIESVKIKFAGSGDLTIEGKANEIDIFSSGSGDLDLSGLAAERADLFVSGSGRLYINVSDFVEGFASGSGRVVIEGGAKVDIENTSSGKIIQR